MQGVGVAHAGAGLGRVVDDDEHPARPQRPVDFAVQHRRVDVAHEFVRIVVVVLRCEDHVQGLWRGELRGRLHHDADVAPGRLGGHRGQGLHVRHGLAGIGRRIDRVNVALGSDDAAEQPGEIARARDQLEHLVAALHAGEGHQFRPVAARVGGQVAFADGVGGDGRNARGQGGGRDCRGGQRQQHREGEARAKSACHRSPLISAIIVARPS